MKYILTILTLFIIIANANLFAEETDTAIPGWPDGTTYAGELRDDLPYGHGRAASPDGTIYEGEWKNGMKNGQGAETSTDGVTSLGEWVDNYLILGSVRLADPVGTAINYEGEYTSETH